MDCDGVIVDTEQAWDESNRIFLERRGVTYVRAVHKPMLTGRAAAEGVRVLQELFGFEGDPTVLAEERRALVRAQLADEVGFVPGFEVFFAWARTRVPIAIATGMEASMFAFVDQMLGLAEMFDGNVVVSSDVERSKPAPDLFLAAAARIGIPPSACLVIEDAPLGIEAARRAGMASIALATTYPASLLGDATVVARDWTAAHDAIRTLIGPQN